MHRLHWRFSLSKSHKFSKIPFTTVQYLFSPFRNNYIQERIPVGCVSPASVAISGVGGCVCLRVYTSPLWTEFLTHACENITFPQLLMRVVIKGIILRKNSEFHRICDDVLCGLCDECQDRHLVTVRQRSCGKVMFSVVSAPVLARPLPRHVQTYS